MVKLFQQLTIEVNLLCELLRSGGGWADKQITRFSGTRDMNSFY